jgi:hypothetical protein
MSLESWVRWGGFAAIAGGAMWAVKAVAILVSGDQPPYFFEAAPLPFAIALLVLRARLGEAGGSLVTAGRLVALVVIAASAVNLLEESLTDREVVPAISSAVDALVGVGPLIGLILLGYAGRRRVPPSWRPGPLELAALYPLSAVLLVPLAVIVDLDGATGERLIEIPVLAIGLGWIALGLGLARSAVDASDQPGTPRPSRIRPV